MHRFDVKTIKNVELRRKTFKTTQNYKSNQITITCINFKSKTSKQRKTTNTIKLRRFASIWRQNDLNNAKLQKRWNYDNFHRFDVKTIKMLRSSQNIQYNAKLQKRPNYNELHRLDVETIKNVELRRKTFKPTQNCKTDQITITCINLKSKR